MIAEERVILVDKNDVELGSEEKIKAHRESRLHRAFSIFVFDDTKHLLIQRRAATKYHSPGLWSNTCCGHPTPGEPIEQAIHRRLKEEMGFDCPLGEAFTFLYQVNLGDGLTEHEYDHVFVGRFNGMPVPSPDEVQEWKWISIDALREDLHTSPDHYTYWLPMCLNQAAEPFAFCHSEGVLPKKDD